MIFKCYKLSRFMSNGNNIGIIFFNKWKFRFLTVRIK